MTSAMLMRRLLSSIVLTAATACSGSKPEPPATLVIAPATAQPAVPGTAGAPGPSPLLMSKESKAVAQTLERMSAIRGIRATRAVPGVTLDREKLVERVKDKALREFPADALRREGQLLQLLGFAPSTFDYMGETLKLLEEQLEGFYEPNNGTMYLAADLRGPEAEATLAHELVHALQDQTWDLKSRSTYRPGKGDETLALACLAEGDATSSMMDFMLASKHQTALDLNDDILREMMTSAAGGPGTKSVPHILRTTLVAPYVDGLSFIHALRRRGGWPMVNQVWARPPVTTEQVLHVEKWEQNERALDVAPPTATALGTSWTLAEEDSFGELGFAIAFEEWVSNDDARAAATGWGGDRSAVYTKGDEIAFAVRVRYDDATAAAPASLDRNAFAIRAMGMLVPGWKKKLGKPAIDKTDLLCFDRKELGPLILARRGRDLVLAAGPARHRTGPWTSTSTCTQAKTWALEILAMP